MSLLREVAATAEPAVAAHAVDEPGSAELAELVGAPERGFVIEAVYEGHLLHYGTPRAFAGMDDDLRLLAGDAMYALGLERLARADDLEAVAELADLVTASARAEVEGRSGEVPGLWRSSAERLAGATPQ